MGAFRRMDSFLPSLSKRSPSIVGKKRPWLIWRRVFTLNLFTTFTRLKMISLLLWKKKKVNQISELLQENKSIMYLGRKITCVISKITLFHGETLYLCKHGLWLENEIEDDTIQIIPWTLVTIEAAGHGDQLKWRSTGLPLPCSVALSNDVNL